MNGFMKPLINNIDNSEQCNSTAKPYINNNINTYATESSLSLMKIAELEDKRFQLIKSMSANVTIGNNNNPTDVASFVVNYVDEIMRLLYDYKGKRH